MNEIAEIENEELATEAEVVKPMVAADVIVRARRRGVPAQAAVAAPSGSVLEMTPYEERAVAIARLTERAIELPMFKRCTLVIASMHAAGKSKVPTPRGMLITGLTGSGKSTIAKHYRDGHPRFEGKDRTVIPVLYVELPSQPSAKAIAERILVELGDPYFQRGSTEDKLHRVRTLLIGCRVELIILDEFQHITDRLDARTRDIAGDMLKNLMNESNLPFVFLGGPSCRSYFVTNQQLGRRCTPKVQLPPFSLATQDQRLAFQKLLKSLDVRLPFEDRSALVEVSMARRLWMASFGLVGQLTQLIGAALEIALESGAPTLSIQHLSAGFATTIYEGCPAHRNPFEERFNNRPLTEAGEPFHGFVA